MIWPLVTRDLYQSADGKQKVADAFNVIVLNGVLQESETRPAELLGSVPPVSRERFRT